MKFLDELKNWAQSIFFLLFCWCWSFIFHESKAWHRLKKYRKALETVAVLFVFSSVIYFIFSIILLLSFFSVLKKGQRKKNNDSNNTLKFTNQNTHTDQKKTCESKSIRGQRTDRSKVQNSRSSKFIWHENEDKKMEFYAPVELHTHASSSGYEFIVFEFWKCDAPCAVRIMQDF